MNYSRKLCSSRKFELKKKNEQLKRKLIKQTKKGKRNKIMGIFSKFKAISNYFKNKVIFEFIIKRLKISASKKVCRVIIAKLN
jgi:hypothetical protein